MTTPVPTPVMDSDSDAPQPPPSEPYIYKGGYVRKEDKKTVVHVVVAPEMKRIDYQAFHCCTSLVSIQFHGGVTELGARSFYDCSSLESIDLPDSLEKIEYGCFDGCKSLSSIRIPERVEEIEASVFSDCDALSDIRLPEGMTYVAKNAFKDCKSLESIDLPEGVKGIGKNAFVGCSSLSSIRFPDGTKTIRERAFENCESLFSVDINNGLEAIGEGAFDGCKNLSLEVRKRIAAVPRQPKQPLSCTITGGMPSWYHKENAVHATIAPTVTKIDDEAFYGCELLASVQFSEGLKIVGKRAFQRCDNLSTVVLPNGLEVIEKSAFCWCQSLSFVYLPNGLKEIQKSAFRGCGRLLVLEIPSETTIEEDAFKFCETLGKEKNDTESFEPDQLKGRFKKLPLHRACYEFDSQDTKALSSSSNEAARETDEYGLTALHVLAMNPRATASAIELVADRNPEAMTAVAAGGATPLHLAAINAGDHVLEFLPYLTNGTTPGVKLACSIQDADSRTATVRSIQENSNENIRKYLFKCQPCDQSWYKEEVKKLEQNYVDHITSLKPVALSNSLAEKHGWVHFVSDVNDKEYIDKLCDFISGCDKALVRELADAKDDENRKAIDVAVNDIKSAFVARLYFLGRYQIKSGPPLHKSDSCIVVEAFDTKIDQEQNRRVAIKLMIKEEQFQKELEFRRAHEELVKNKAVVPIDKDYILSDSAMESIELEDGEKSNYKFAIVMPCADRNLEDIYRCEQPDMIKIRSIAYDVAKKLRILNENGIIHGDLKMKNIVRMEGNMFLIDLDASVEKNTDSERSENPAYYVGQKFSSGIQPPEMIFRFEEKEEFHKFDSHFVHIEDKDSLLWKKIKPKSSAQSKSSARTYFALKTFATEGVKNEDLKTGEIYKVQKIKQGLPYEPVKATSAIDLWSFGIILYSLCSRRPLFDVKVDDDLSDGKAMRKLYEWSDERKEEVLDGADIQDPHAKDLLRKLLSREPDERGTFNDLLKAPFFDKKALGKLVKRNEELTKEVEKNREDIIRARQQKPEDKNKIEQVEVSKNQCFANGEILDLPDGVDPEVAESAFDLIFHGARSGIVEKKEASGMLLVIGSNENYNKFGYSDEGMNTFEGKDIDVKKWKDFKTLIMPCFVKDGALFINGETGIIMADSYIIDLYTRNADRPGGTGHRNASAVGMNGGFAIKCSEDCCSIDGNGKASLKVFPGTKKPRMVAVKPDGKQYKYVRGGKEVLSPKN